MAVSVASQKIGAGPGGGLPLASKPPSPASIFSYETAGRFMAETARRRLPFGVSLAKTRAGPRAEARLRAAPPLRAARSAPPASQLGPLALKCGEPGRARTGAQVQQEAGRELGAFPLPCCGCEPKTV